MTENASPKSGSKNQRPRETWNHTTPVTFSPLFDWPPNIKGSIIALTKRWVTISRNVLFLLMAWLVYRYLVPSMATMESLSFGWVGGVFLRNFLIMLIITGGLHLYLFTFRLQGKKLKYDHKVELDKSRKFSFNNQVWDNMFWALVGGSTLWSLYEVLYFWGLANGVIPSLGFVDHPIIFVCWLLVLPVFTSSHFYLIHRLLHWPPLYRKIHSVHHRNIHIGPWSGMSMHPIEQLIYISSVLVHFVIPSHPVILILHLYSRCLGPAFSHSGFEKLLVKDTSVVDAADFHHQLHHRFFECNYGTVDAPWDRWFNSYHDGSDEATVRVREQRKQMYRNKPPA